MDSAEVKDGLRHEIGTLNWRQCAEDVNSTKAQRLHAGGFVAKTSEKSAPSRTLIAREISQVKAVMY